MTTDAVPTSNTTTNATNVAEPEPYDPVSAFEYSCNMCAQKGFAYDQGGCFNQTLLPKRLNSQSITTYKGCFANGYWIKTNNQSITIPDTSKLTDSTGLWNFTYQCKTPNEEFYLQIANKLAHVNQISANITSLTESGTEGFLYTYCHGASNKDCGEINSTTGFTNYSIRPDEKIEFYLYCAGSVEKNITIIVTAKYLYFVDNISEGLSGGGIAGIVIACIIVLVVGLGILISQKGVGGLRCCKNKTQQIPENSPRVPKDID